MRIDILTLFPEVFPAYLDSSIIGRAKSNRIIEINVIDIRSFAHDRHATVDDKPYGGGPGMLMKPDVLIEAVEAFRTPKTTVILTTPRGERFEQRIARQLSLKNHLLIVSGHYEGVDQRFIDLVVERELSIGDYVLTNGNLASMVIADAVARLLPGVLGKDESSVDESHSAGLLEYPQYTHPAEFRGAKVPEILLSGDHAKIAKWRHEESVKLTKQRRPDLYYQYQADPNEF